ncbi:DUF692 domain-containing protein [Balamuthia mandrillaris]
MKEAEASKPWVGLSLMPGGSFRRAVAPLFDAGQVEAVEWSMDIGWAMGKNFDPWVKAVLQDYSQRNRLFGHGVLFSPLSAEWQSRQAQWIESLKQECKQLRYRHITEHYGFMTIASTTSGCPLPQPHTSGGVKVARERLRMLSKAAGKGVKGIGLENLALAMGMQDVLSQGTMILDIIRAIDEEEYEDEHNEEKEEDEHSAKTKKTKKNGIMLLDLHNLYCQLWNFGLKSWEEALRLYPLDRVHAIHISGGSWSYPLSSSDSSTDRPKAFRRDTHDGPVPEVIFEEALPLALRMCPNVEVVILERIGNTIQESFNNNDKDEGKDAERLRADYRRMLDVVKRFREERKAEEKRKELTAEENETEEEKDGEVKKEERVNEVIYEDEELKAYQNAFIQLFLEDRTPQSILAELQRRDAFQPFQDYISSFELPSIEVTASLVKKWVE